MLVCAFRRILQNAPTAMPHAAQDDVVETDSPIQAEHDQPTEDPSYDGYACVGVMSTGPRVECMANYLVGSVTSTCLAVVFEVIYWRANLICDLRIILRISSGIVYCSDHKHGVFFLYTCAAKLGS